MSKKNIIKKHKTHIKTGDTVKIISGKYKGQTGKVIRILSKRGKIIVESINLVTKHIKPKREGETGQITKMEAPIHISNIMLYSNA